MYYSYVMGIGNEIEELKDKGFTIEQFGQNYGVSFPKEKADEWEHFIEYYLEIGYWNEVLTLCEKLCECKFTSIRDMLKENYFYSDKLI